MTPKANVQSSNVTDPRDLRIAQLEAELAKAREANSQPVRLKASEKGAVSIYGLNARFPVTLYPEQLEKIFARVDEIRAFIKAGQEQGTISKGKDDPRFAKDTTPVKASGTKF